MSGLSLSFSYSTGKIGIILKHTIAASMKDALYEVNVAFTDDELLSCECDCQAGSKGLDRGVCVHILPNILMLVLLLIDGLAENILIELCHRWNEHLEIELRDDIESIQKAVFSLITASGGSDNIEKIQGNMAVTDILNEFRVGTEKAKRMVAPPRSEELVPLRLMNMTSNSGEIKRKMKWKKQKKTNPLLNPSLNPTLNASLNASLNAPANLPLNAPLNAPSNAPLNLPLNAPTNPPTNPPTNAPLKI